MIVIGTSGERISGTNSTTSTRLVVLVVSEVSKARRWAGWCWAKRDRRTGVSQEAVGGLHSWICGGWGDQFRFVGMAVGLSTRVRSERYIHKAILLRWGLRAWNTYFDDYILKEANRPLYINQYLKLTADIFFTYTFKFSWITFVHICITLIGYLQNLKKSWILNQILLDQAHAAKSMTKAVLELFVRNNYYKDVRLLI